MTVMEIEPCSTFPLPLSLCSHGHAKAKVFLALMLFIYKRTWFGSQHGDGDAGGGMLEEQTVKKSQLQLQQHN
jgi:hypothetical protein